MNLNLEFEEVKVVLTSLQEFPYKLSAPIINKIVAAINDENSKGVNEPEAKEINVEEKASVKKS